MEIVQWIFVFGLLVAFWSVFRKDESLEATVSSSAEELEALATRIGKLEAFPTPALRRAVMLSIELESEFWKRYHTLLEVPDQRMSISRRFEFWATHFVIKELGQADIVLYGAIEHFPDAYIIWEEDLRLRDHTVTESVKLKLLLKPDRFWLGWEWPQPLSEEMRRSVELVPALWPKSKEALLELPFAHDSMPEGCRLANDDLLSPFLGTRYRCLSPDDGMKWECWIRDFTLEGVRSD